MTNEKREKKMQLGICIPTYNRLPWLKKNLDSLCSMIEDSGLQHDIMIFVSDNCSGDGTEEYMETIANNPDNAVNIKYNRNKKNLGPIDNFLFLIDHIDSKFVMLLGDDDFISKEYLVCAYEATHKDVICIVPSYLNVNIDGEYTGRGRDTDKESRCYEKGFKNCLENSWRGHQMSGLVFERNMISKESAKTDNRNMYLMIYWIGYLCMNGNTLHLTEYPVLVTRPPQKDKTWGYGSDGLISDIFCNYKMLKSISPVQRHRLEMKVLVEQYWRYAMYLKKGPIPFIRCLWNIIISENTGRITKIVFPFAVAFILTGVGFRLLFKGELLKTLRTTVDI